MQVLDLYCLARFESEVQAEEKSIKDYLENNGIYPTLIY